MNALNLLLAATLTAPAAAAAELLAGEERLALSCRFDAECPDAGACKPADLSLSIDGLLVDLGSGLRGAVATIGTDEGDIESVGVFDRGAIRIGGDGRRHHHLLTSMADGARYTLHGRRAPFSTTYIGSCE